jgi:hypothetical protein
MKNFTMNEQNTFSATFCFLAGELDIMKTKNDAKMMKKKN